MKRATPTRAAMVQAFNAPIFSEDHARELIPSAKPDAVAFELNEAAKMYVFDAFNQSKMSDRELIERAGEIAKASKKILVEAQWFSDRADLPPRLGAGGLYAFAALAGAASGKDEILEAMQGVERLMGYAKALEKRAKRLRDEPRNGAPEDVAFKALLRRLAGVYLEYAKRAPKVETIDGEPGGAFLDFAVKAVEIIADAGWGAPKNGVAIAKCFSRMRGQRFA